MRKIKNVILGLLIGCTAFAVTGVFGLTNENTAYAATDGVYNVRTDELIPDYASNGIDEKWEGNFIYSTNKTIDYECENIEDFMAHVNSYQFINHNRPSDSYRTEDGNVFIHSYDYNEGDYGVPSFKIKGSYERAAIRYKFKYEAGKEIFIAYDLRATADNAFYWSDGGQTVLMFDWKDASTWRLTVFPDGIDGKWRDASLWGSNTGISFDLVGGEYVYCDFGYMPVQDAEPDSDENGMYVFVNYYTVDADGNKREDNQIYAQAKLTGDFCINNTGWIEFYNSCHNTLGNYNDPVNHVQDYLIEGIESSVFSKFNPVINVAKVRGQYDLSELVPVSQNGVVYSAAADKSDASRSMFNAYMPRNNMSVDFGVTFTEGDNTNLGFDMSMRATSSHGVGGYSVSIQKSNRAKQFIVSMTNDSAKLDYEKGKTYRFRLYCHDFSYGTELEVSGVRLALYTLDENMAETLVLEDFIEILPSENVGEWFTGVINGNSSSFVTITPLNYKAKGATVTVKAGKTNVAIGKIVRFEYESSLATYNDVATYVITEGEQYAKIAGNGITGVADGVVKVKAVITNEYGTFESEEITVTVGSGKQEENKGCGSSLSGNAITLAFASLVCVSVLVKKRKHA